jgi:hypothetical protein
MHDIRLGDVVVRVPTKQHGGVIHYEFGKSTQNQRISAYGAPKLTPKQSPCRFAGPSSDTPESWSLD